MNKRETFKTTLFMPVSLAKEVSNRAIENGGRRNTIILNAIRYYLDKLKASPTIEKAK